MKKDVEWYEVDWQRLAENPTVANLVGFRKESEEKEVTALESIREEIWEEMLRLEDKRKERWADIRYITLREVLQKLGHLDEPETLSIDKEQLIKRIENYIPLHDKTVGDVVDGILETVKQLPEMEVLSPKWIDEHAKAVVYDGTPDGIEIVYVDELENLLVPKKELPVVPKYVAEYLELAKSEVSLMRVLEIANRRDELPKWEKEYDWISANGEAFARAWLDGYTAEEEPLYTARLKAITDEYIASYLRTQSSDDENRLNLLEIGNKYIYEDYRHQSEFTEDELKVFNIWDSDQWEIEEVEE